MLLLLLVLLLLLFLLQLLLLLLVVDRRSSLLHRHYAPECTAVLADCQASGITARQTKEGRGARTTIGGSISCCQW